MIDDMPGVEVVVAHSERATLRVGDVFLKVDPDDARISRELEAMERAPIPAPDVLWRKPPVLALAALPGEALGVLDQPSYASSAAWSAAGGAAARLHAAPPPPWPSSQCQQRPVEVEGQLQFPPLLDSECAWLVANNVVPANVVDRCRQLARPALRPWEPTFIHGDLQIVHVFVEGDQVSGVLDWSEAGHGDAMYDVATLTLAHSERLDEVVAGYGGEVDVEVVRAYWALRSLMQIQWLARHGYGDPTTFPEVEVLHSLAAEA